MTTITRLAHIIGTNSYVVLDNNLEAVLGFGETLDQAIKIQCEIETRNTGFDFEKIYKLYPRKINKATGIKWLKNNIKSRSRYERLLEAVNNYASHCINDGVEEKFQMHFSTWVRRFEDWTTENLKGSSVPQVQIARHVLDGIDIEKLLLGGM